MKFPNPPKIVDYHTCTAETIAELDKKVNEYLQKGYSLLGKMQINNHTNIKYQTMVKYG